MDQHPLPGTPALPAARPAARTAARTVRLATSFVSGDAQADVLAGELGYDPRDPFAVTMDLFASGGRVTWTFARDLLAEGLYEPSGDGDVHVWPCLSSTGEAVVVIELTSPEGTAMLQTSSRLVRRFVDDTCAVVPLGHESRHLAVDDLVARLLQG